MPKNVTTSQGDTWDIIAYRLYGDEKLAIRLLEANPEHAKTVFFSAGTSLRAPDVKPLKKKGPLPPWRS